jgi:hypothetical protein
VIEYTFVSGPSNSWKLMRRHVDGTTSVVRRFNTLLECVRTLDLLNGELGVWRATSPTESTNGQLTTV